MKKSIFIMAVFFSFAVMFTACKETKKEEVKSENLEEHEHDNDEMASKDVYQCPMDCEEGKTYDVVGSCPVCEMDLKEVKSSQDTNSEQKDDNDSEHKEDNAEHKDSD
jgi:hypothetical protein